MFKCLCGGASNANNNHNNNNNHRTKNGKSGNISNGLNGTELTPHIHKNGDKLNNGNILHPDGMVHNGHSNGHNSNNNIKISSEAGGSSSPKTTTTTTTTKSNNKNVSEYKDEDEAFSITSEQHSAGSSPFRHQRKRTHTYKRRDPNKGSIANISSPGSPGSIPHQIQMVESHESNSKYDRISSNNSKTKIKSKSKSKNKSKNKLKKIKPKSASKQRIKKIKQKSKLRAKPKPSPRSKVKQKTKPMRQKSPRPSLDDYFVNEDFKFSVENFDFNSHYKFLIELAIKCLDQGPDILNPHLFFKHNEIKCCVAILHENNGKKVAKSYYKEIISSNDGNINDGNINYGKRNKNHQQIIDNKKSSKTLKRERREKEEILLNNVIGFALCYPHSNCRPYPDSVWMLGWLMADHHRVKSIDSQHLIIESLIRQSAKLINPNSVNKLPQIQPPLKQHLIINNNATQTIHKLESNLKGQLSDLDEKDEDILNNNNNNEEKTQISVTNTTQTDNNNEFTVSRSNRYLKNERNSNNKYDNNKRDKNKKKEKKARDKGIGIYAPYYHKGAQKLYEALGFEKIAKIGNYYTTDQTFFAEYYKSDQQKENNDNDGLQTPISPNNNILNSPSNRSHRSSNSHNSSSKDKKFNNDAYLYCRGDLAHCRLLLGMEYFNYKKWPKSPLPNQDENGKDNKDKDNNMKEQDDEKQIKNDKKSSKDNKDKDGKKKKNNGPKILEEYLQSRIAAYHKQQQEAAHKARLAKQVGRTRENGNRHVHRSGNKHSSRHTQKDIKRTNQGSSMPNVHGTTHSNIPSTHIVNNNSAKIHVIPTHNHPNNGHHINHGHHPSHHSTHGVVQHRNKNHRGGSHGGYHPSHGANSGQFDPNYVNQQGATGQPPYIGRSGSAYTIHDPRKIRFKNHPSGGSSHHNLADRPSQHVVDENNNNDTLSPNQAIHLNGNGVSIHHNKNGSIASNVSSIATNTSALDRKASTRNSSIANSQIHQTYGHHHGQNNSGHSHYYSHYQNNGHHPRTTYTQSQQLNPLQGQGHSTGAISSRPSATPTYDAQSQHVYYPNLANHSTYTVNSNDTGTDNQTVKSSNRGTSFYGGSTRSVHSQISYQPPSHAHMYPLHSNPSQHSHDGGQYRNSHGAHSHHSGHSHHHHHVPSQPYIHPSQHSSHHHPNNRHNDDHPYNGHHSSYHKHHDSYHDDPHNYHHNSSHKGRSNKNNRYRTSSRHSKKPN